MYYSVTNVLKFYCNVQESFENGKVRNEVKEEERVVKYKTRKVCGRWL